MLHRLAIFSMLLIFGSCSSGRVVEAQLDVPFDLPFSETAVVARKLPVRFAELVDDSRCPRSVQCVWEGNAQIRLEIGAGNAPLLLNTKAGPRYPDESIALGYRVRLVELRPYPAAPGNPDPREYVAQLVVSSE